MECKKKIRRKSKNKVMRIGLRLTHDQIKNMRNVTETKSNERSINKTFKPVRYSDRKTHSFSDTSLWFVSDCEEK